MNSLIEQIIKEADELIEKDKYARFKSEAERDAIFEKFIADPFGTGTVGLYGGAAVSASTEYTVSGVDILLTSSGGADVSISIKDAADNVLASGLTTCTALYLPVGYKVNFGAFSGAPTVVVFGC